MFATLAGERCSTGRATMTTDQVLLITTTDRVRLLTLNRPERRNALSKS